jgi:AraC-like DNA-binding protein
MWYRLSMDLTRRLIAAGRYQAPGRRKPNPVFRPTGSHLIQVQLAGRRCMSYEGVRTRLGPGDLTVNLAGREYPNHGRVIDYAAAHVRVQALPADRPVDQPGAEADAVYVQPVVDTRGHPRLVDCIDTVARELRSSLPLSDQAARVEFNRFLLELGRLCWQALPEADVAIHELIRYLERHPAERLSLDELAERAGMSRRSLTQRFRKSTGQSITRFRQDLRVRLAADLMTAHPELSLAGVAEQAGFSDAFYFSKVFKRITGTTPSAFRRAGRL